MVPKIIIHHRKLGLFVSMAAEDLTFSEEEMALDEGLGHPRAYAKLCRDKSFGPYSHGPPFTFTPYALSHREENGFQKHTSSLFDLLLSNPNPIQVVAININIRHQIIKAVQLDRATQRQRSFLVEFEMR